MLGRGFDVSEISIAGKKGGVIARTNLVLCFFGQSSVGDWAEAGAMCFDEWLKVVPQDSLAWSLIGASASSYAAANARTVARCRALLEAAKSKDQLQSFELLGPDRYTPDLSFAWAADPDSLDEDSEITNFIEMRFPVSYLDAVGPEAFVSWAIERSRVIPYDSGSAAISLVTHESTSVEASSSIGPLALRHFGYDVSDNRGTRLDLGDRTRGPQWLTFIGKSLVARLGGDKKIKAALSGYQVSTEANGVAVLTSPTPDIGDTNAKKLVASLRPLAALLEPVTYFGDYGLDDLLGGDDKRERWERRFLE
jgi:hypothetical protein